MKIGVFADSHYCTKDELCGTRRPALSLSKLKNALWEFKKQGVERILCLGDLVDTDDTAEQNAENLRRAASLLAETGLPCCCCMGNHDAALFSKNEFANLTGFTLAPAVIKAENAALILLDANFNLDGSPYEPGKVNWTETVISQAQILWLKQTLADCRGLDVYVFIHQNLDPAVDTSHVVQNAAEVNRILADGGNVRAVYQGHYHPGAVNVHNGIPYITLQAMCEGTENSFRVIAV